MSKSQLFCFTYAGGNATFFDVIEKDLTDFDLVKIEYSGHGTRYKEPFYSDFEELVADIYELFKRQYSGGIYALFGYSMGTITLIELIKRILDDQSVNKPAHVFLAAHEPCLKEELVEYTDNELDEWVRDRTIKFGAIPEKLLNNESFWRVYLPIFRADFSIISKYRFESMNIKTTIPATIFYSESDTPQKKIELWRNYFINDCEFYQFTGTHFFIQEHHKEMARIMDLRMYQGVDYAI